MSRAEEFVRSMHWDYRRTEGHNGPQLLVKVCPFCLDDKGTHFYIGDAYNGPFICHHCQRSGSLDDLMEAMGHIQPVRNPYEEQQVTMTPEEAAVFYTRAHQELLVNPTFHPLLEWLTKTRHISLDVIREMKVGARTNYGKKWICFPYWIGDVVHCSKERTIEKDFVYLYFVPNKGGPLYNQDILQALPSYVIITEGEMDTLALMSMGFNRVVSVSNGSNYINSAWLPVLQKVKKIYLAYDGDAKGREGARNFAKQLGLERTYVVPFTADEKDANNYLCGVLDRMGEGATYDAARIGFVERFLKTARLLEIEGVISLDSVFREMVSKTDLLDRSEIDTPWPTINRLIDREGFSGGDLIVLSSDPGIGKTTWALDVFHHVGKKGIPVMFYELEYGPQRLVQRLISLDQQVAKVTVENIISAHETLGKLPMYFGLHAGGLNLERALETIRAAHNRYTLGFVVFDHIHFLVRSIRYDTQELSLAVKSFKELAKELDVPILLIAHLSKIQPDNSGRRREPDASNLRGTQMLWADADLVFLLHRDRTIEADARNALEGTFMRLKRKNPGLVSMDDLLDYVKGGKAQDLKGVKEATESKLVALMEKADDYDDLLDVYSPDTKVILQKNRFGPGGVRHLLYHGSTATFEEVHRG